MDACSGLEAFCRGEEDELLSVRKVRFVGGRYIYPYLWRDPKNEWNIKARRSMNAA